jgi:hypothetical protein
MPRATLSQAFYYHYHLDHADAARHGITVQYSSITVRLAKAIEELYPKGLPPIVVNVLAAARSTEEKP